MKLTEAPSKIIGVTLGEASLNLIRPDIPPIKAKFALLTKTGEACGFMETNHEWSEKVLLALAAFTEALEEDALARITDFTPAAEAQKTEAANEPPQF